VEGGIRLVLVTGRRHPSARLVADDLGGHVPLVLHNGALVVEDGKVLRCRPLDRGTAQLAIRVGEEAGGDAVVHHGLSAEGKLMVTAGRRSNTLLAYYLDRQHPDVSEVDDLAAALDFDPIQVMYGGPIEPMETVLEALRPPMDGRARIERTVYPRNGLALLDIVDPGVGKAEALAWLRERWGITAAETMAVGDNWNDHGMLQEAGLGLVMGNADPGTLSLGLPILPTNDEDGVAVAVERHLL
jgi:HAD superfamily hydrolase (TIGR01484 family)